MKSISKILFITFCILLITGSILKGQVKIKERVEINPDNTYKRGTPIIMSDTTDVDTLPVAAKLEIKSAWQQEYYPDGTPMLRVRYKVMNSNCGDILQSDWDYLGTMTFNVEPVKPTSYTIIANMHQWSKIDSTWIGIPANTRFDVYVDGEKYKEAGGNSIVDPWFGDIMFQVYSYGTLNLNEGVTFQGYKKGDNTCGEVIGNMNRNFITFSIVNGAEYLSFYEYSTGNNIGDSFREDQYNWSGILLKYDNQYYGYSNYIATIEAKVNNFFKMKTITLKAKEPDCSDAPQCTTTPKNLSFHVNPNPNKTFNVDACSEASEDLGIFKPLVHKVTKEIEPCFNTEEGHWQFNVTPITIESILDLCEDKMNEAELKYGFQFKNSVDDIPLSDVCDAISDLEDFKTYGEKIILRQNAYVFIPLLLAHEAAHSEYFLEVFNPSLQEIDSKFREFKPTCLEVSDVYKAREKAITKLNGAMIEPFNNALALYKLKIGQFPKSESNRLTWEKEVHSRVQSQIKHFIDLLDKKN